MKRLTISLLISYLLLISLPVSRILALGLEEQAFVTILTIPYKSGNVGIFDQNEITARGPESFYVTMDGYIYIADSVNNRIIVYNGDTISEIMDIKTEDIIIDIAPYMEVKSKMLV